MFSYMCHITVFSYCKSIEVLHLHGMECLLCMHLCCITGVLFELFSCLRMEDLLKEGLDGASCLLKVPDDSRKGSGGNLCDI